MFETDKGLRRTGINTIIKIDGANRFVDITQAFGIGKIKLAFREYDKDKAPGSRTSRELDCYLSMEDASYLANLCTSHAFIDLGQKNEQRRAESNYDYAMPIFETYSGKEEKDASGRVTKTISRHLSLSRKSPKEGGTNTKIPYTLKLEVGPGIKTQTGAYMPDKNAKGGKQYIPIGMSVSQVIKMGIAIERAINMYDMLVATGLLERRVNEMRDISMAEANEGKGYNAGAGRSYASGSRPPQPQQNVEGYYAKPNPQNRPQAPVPNENGEISGYVPKAKQRNTMRNADGSINGYARAWQ